MALTTTFKRSVPYNTIRLAGDVAQWSQTEQTHLDNSTYPLIPNMIDVSMGHMQKASGANIDPGDGTISQVGTLGDMRYGVAINTDISAGDGVYEAQIAGANPFVGVRNYNLSGNPTDVRLSRMGKWDYTANLEMPDIDLVDFQISTTADYRATSIGHELFKDQPMWGWGVRDSVNTSSRQVVILRAHPNGGRYSSYAVTNRLLVSHVSDMNDILALIPVRSSYGTTLGTNIRSFITFGRRTSSTGNLKAGLYNLNISATSWSSSSSTTANIPTQFSNNSAANGGCYLRDDLVAVCAGRGAAGRDLIRVTTTGGTISSSYTSLTTASSYGAQGIDVIAIPDEEGSSPLAFPIWTELRSTYNRYVKMRAYNMNTGFTSVSNVLTVFDLNNTIKSAGGALLKAGSNTAADPHVFLVWCSDTSGNIRLQAVKMGQGTLITSGLPSATINFNDTNLDQMVVISPLSAVEKTDISFSGETFTPGGTNNFKKRRYFAVSAATNQTADPCGLYYGYYDMDNDTLQVWDGGSFTGREMRLARNPHDTESRTYAKDLYYRGEAGAVWMPFLGGRYVSSTSRRLTMGMASLDYKPYWANLNAGDPGGTVYDQSGKISTSGAYFDTRGTEPTWGETGRWYVRGPHPLYPGNTTNLIYFRDSFNANVTFSDGVGSGLQFFTGENEDIDGILWDDFIGNTVKGFNQNNHVYIKVELGNGTNATYRLNAGSNGVSVNGSDWLIQFPSAGNNHSGNQWGWLWNSTTGETKNAVGITFSQSPF